jgi:microcystin-dependent protein
MSTPYLGEIRLFPYNFAPHNWTFCQGQLMLISQNTALFSLIGTFYGGNGTTNFALPDLRGRVAVGMGTGSGLSAYSVGQVGGAETVTLLQSQLPAHTHTQPVTNSAASGSRPNGAVPATGGSYAASSDGGAFVPTSATGGGQPFGIVQPYLAMTYCIALSGVFPSRN